MSQTHAGPDGGSTYHTPRWVKVSGIIVIVLVLLAAVVLITSLGGNHGPGRHTGGGDTPPIEQGVEGAAQSVGDENSADATPGGHVPPVQHGG